MKMSRPKIKTLFLLDLLFNGEACSLSLLILTYMIFWYIGITVIPDFLPHVFDGVFYESPPTDPGIIWSTILLLVSLVQTLCCLYGGASISKYVRLFLSILMCISVIYTTITPIIYALNTYHWFPQTGASGIVIALASVVVVARQF